MGIVMGRSQGVDTVCRVNKITGMNQGNCAIDVLTKLALGVHGCVFSGMVSWRGSPPTFSFSISFWMMMWQEFLVGVAEVLGFHGKTIMLLPTFPFSLK